MDEEKKNYLSQEKYDELQEELNMLKSEKRKEVADNLEYAKSLGDTSENAEYQEARADQVNVERRIMELESMLKNVQIIEKHHSNVVEMGAVVEVQKAGDDKVQKYQIVGSEEANTDEGKLSNVSPLGEALMDGKKGDVVSFNTPSGKIEYKIVGIE